MTAAVTSVSDGVGDDGCDGRLWSYGLDGAAMNQVTRLVVVEIEDFASTDLQNLVATPDPNPMNRLQPHGDTGKPIWKASTWQRLGIGADSICTVSARPSSSFHLFGKRGTVCIESRFWIIP